MTLELSHRWEHALLATVVAEASAANPDGYVGRTAIQKLLYFMRVLGVPMSYSFEIYTYGPFCSRVLSDVDWLLNDEVISDESSQSHYSNYKPGPNLPELTRKFQEPLQANAATIQNVAKEFGRLPADQLELYATLDYCFRWVRATGGNGPWKDKVVERFIAIKKDKFPLERIQSDYRVLVEAGLIES